MMYSFAHAETGLFSGKRFNGSAKLVAQNTPRDYIAVPGIHDRNTRRLDVVAMKAAENPDVASFVIDYQRPAAEIEAEQNARRDEDARRRLREIDLAMVRPLAQLLKDPQHSTALAAIAELEAEAAEIRSDVVPTAAERARATRLQQP